MESQKVNISDTVIPRATVPGGTLLPFPGLTMQNGVASAVLIRVPIHHICYTTGNGGLWGPYWSSWRRL